jgi:hypothetical protein
MARTTIVFNNLPGIVAKVEAALEGVIKESAENIREDVHREMNKPKHGRFYVIGGKPHTASAPGEAPAVFTGDLIASIKEKKVGKLTWIVPAEGKQALWEYGLYGFPARPYFRPASAKEFPNFERECIKALKSV